MQDFTQASAPSSLIAFRRRLCALADQQDDLLQTDMRRDVPRQLVNHRVPGEFPASEDQMREIVYALLYLACAAVLTAFPAFMLFLLLREPPDVSEGERMPALISKTLQAKTPALAATSAADDPQPRPQPAWIAATPKYEYDRPSIAPSGANAVEAFAAETDHEDASAENRSVRKLSSSKERQVITPQFHSAFGRGNGEVFDTPPLAPD